MKGSETVDGDPAEEDPDLVVLVETPRWGDAKFFGRWLVAAAEAQQALENALASDRDLWWRIEYPRGPFRMQLDVNAMYYLRRLCDSSCSFVVYMNSPDGQIFFVLVQMGLFVQTGTRYRMIIPKSITPKGAAVAVEQLLGT